MTNDILVQLYALFLTDEEANRRRFSGMPYCKTIAAILKL